MSNIINVKFYIDDNVYQKEYDKQTVITLLNNNDITNDKILLGWSTNNTVDNETIIYNGIYIPDINESEELNFYPIWEEENDTSIQTININFNDTKETSITTIPYENLSDDEKTLALTNNTSTVSFCYRLNYIDKNNISQVFTQKFNVEYEGTDWTLNEIKTESEYLTAIERLESKITEILIEILGEDKKEDIGNNIKEYYQIVWYRKSNLMNDWTKVQNGDTLIGNVMLLEDKSLFVLPIIEANEEYIKQSYLSNDTNYEVHLNKWLHTSNGVVEDNKVNIKNTARQYGVIEVLDSNNDVIFTSQKNEYESTAITVKNGNKYTLIAYPLHQGSKFVGWFRREEVRDDEKKTITIDYYQVSGPDETKYEIVVEDKDIYNQYGALFIGKPINEDISNYNEYKFSTDNVENKELKYYTFLTIEKKSILSDIKQLTPQYSDNIIIHTNEGCKYIHIFTSKNNITFKINETQSNCSNISYIQIENIKEYTSDEYINETNCDQNIINELISNFNNEINAIYAYIIPCSDIIYGTICINVLDK